VSTFISFIIEEYKKGYHILLFYGKLLVVIALGIANERVSGFLTML
jgi:hypothetical protein